MPSKTSQIQDFARRGIYVFPCQPNEKKPVKGLRWLSKSTRDSEKIRAWEERYPGCNWAADCGKSGLVVVDVDTKGEKSGRDTLFSLEINKSLELPSTLTIITPSGGEHRYYRGTTKSGNQKLGLGVDIKSQGGYVLIPGSVIDGKEYTIQHDVEELPEIPYWVLKYTKPPREKDPQRDKPLVELDMEKNIQDAIHYLENRASPSIQGHGGDDNAFKVAAKLRDFAISEPLALELMLSHWNDHCEPPWDVEELKVKVRNAYAYAQNRLGAGTAAGVFADEPVASPFDCLDGDEWEDPLLLEMGSRPEFPIESLPVGLKGFVQEAATALQVPTGMVASTALAVVATVTQKIAKVSVQQGWEEFLNIYVAVGMDSGERKSATVRRVQEPLLRHERMQSQLMEEEISLAKSRLRSLEHQLNLAEKKEGEAKRSKLAVEVEEAKKAIPVPVRFFVDDITPEQLPVIMAEQNESITAMSTESSFFETTVGGRYTTNGSPNMELVLKAHSGDSYRMDRRNGTSIYLHYPRLTMAMIVQPEVIRGLAAKPGARGKGLLARILWCLPQSRVGFRDTKPPPISKESAIQYDELIKRLLVLGKGGPCD